ncbi:MAG: PAS domain-containing protein [Acidobacteria bacterium]|nr:PAS domain-containing protein [Acidobacteriota bacterium]
MTVANKIAHETYSESSLNQRVLVVGEIASLDEQSAYEFQMLCPDELWTNLDRAGTRYACVVLALPNTTDSLTICQQLRLHRTTSEMPIIVCVTDSNEAAQAIQAGGSDFCFKTNLPAELPARIRLCLLNHLHAQRIAWKLDEQRREIVISHLLMDKVVDALPVSMYVVDRDLRIVAWNRNREIGGQGIDRQQVIGRNVLDVFSKMPRYRLEREFSQVFSTGELLRFEQESTADGEKRHWLISKIPMRLEDDSNEITHVITVGEEITEQKKMNAAIIHAEKLAGIGRLASGIVHEINNPLATIAACTEALQLRLDETTILPHETDNDFREYLRLVNEEAFRCKGITNSLLEFSRHREAEKSPYQLNYLIEQTLRLVKHHPKLKQLPLQMDLAEGLSKISANEGQIKQVFLALITNACDAVSEETGELSIRTKSFTLNGRNFVGAEFSDNGPGIAPEMQAKIFEPFVTTKPFGHGTGLGLAVCYGIITDHGGKIEVDSQVGQGTTMRVLLPTFTETL